jgi:hypothetical protein
MRSSIILTFSFLSVLFAQTQLGSDIDGEMAGDQSGTSVSMSSNGSRVAIGADGNGINYSGHVRVYEYSSGSWSQLGTDIDGEAFGDQSGISVSLNSDGSLVAIGAFLNDGNGYAAGHVRIYYYNGFSWSQLGYDIDGEAPNDQSGASVSLNSDGTRVAIGAPGNDNNGDNSGHVRVYEYSSGSWSQLGSDIDGEAAGDFSGAVGNVSLNSDGTRVAIGASGNDSNGDAAGHVRIYYFNGFSWSQSGSDIDGEAAGDISSVVSLNSDGTRVAIGGYGNVGNGDYAGHVRVYEYSSGSWSQLGSDIDGEAADDWSGTSVSLNSDGTRVAIGADGNDGNGDDAGHVRVYKYSSGSWSQLGSDIDGEGAGDASGWSVSLNSDASHVAIGAYGNNGNGDDAGHVRVYEFDNTPPTMTITAAEGSDGFTSNDPTLSLNFTSSEATTDFAVGDITVTNGALSSFSATSSTVYTATFTPYTEGATTINVAASTFTDATGNNNTAATQFNWTQDRTSATPSGLVATPSVGQVVLTWTANSESDFSYYNVYGGTSSSPTTVLSTVSAGTETYTHTGLTYGTTYYYRISAVDDAGNESGYSNEVSSMPLMFIDIDVSLTGVAASSVDWGDYDNDDDLDLLLTGLRSGSYYSKIYRNDGSDTFTNINASLTGVSRSSSSWGDYDNDGDLDILLTGAIDNSDTKVSKIYRNDGNDTFTELTNVSLTGIWYGSSAWGDYDNDDDLDIILTGRSDGGSFTLIYRNNGSDSFTAMYGIELTQLQDGSVAWGDYDNDGDLDLIITGWEGSSRRCKIYRNDGNDTFNVAALLTGAVSYGNSVAWGDYDGDNDLDILLAGNSYTSKVYRNDGNDSFVDIEASLTGVNNSSVGWGDHDNDGDLDILLTGGTSGSCAYISKIYQNDGSDTFTDSGISLTGLDDGSAAWGDYDSDGDLDFIMTGYYCNNNYISKIYRNDLPDTFSPTMTITATDGSNAVSDGSTTNDAMLSLTFTSSEATTDFAVGDITVSNGALSSFSATSSTVYTATFTPTADGAATIDVAASTFTDAVGNNNTAATQFNWTYDSTAPTMTITATDGSSAVSDGATTNDATLSLTFTSSEATTDFAVGDITVTNGALSSFAATSSTVYTATFTPTADGAATIDVAASTFTDAVGNNNTAASQFNWTYEPIWYISTTGSDETGDGTEASPFATIQKGIDESSSGDTVLVAAGTYTENINYNGKNIVVKSVSGATTSIIEKQDNGIPIVSINNQEPNPVLSGFTIMNGYANEGAGLYLGSSVNTNTFALIENCIIKNNTSVNSGSGAYIYANMYTKNTYPTFSNCTFFGNSNNSIKMQNGRAKIINCTFNEEDTTPIMVNWGLASDSGTVIILNSIFWSENQTQIQFTTDVTSVPALNIDYSIIKNGVSGITTSTFTTIDYGLHNLNISPLFIDSTNNEYQLSDYSPAIGAGTATSAPTTDIEGNPRPNPVGSNPDMGVYENALGSPANTPPTITSISNVSILEDASEQTVNMSGIGDGDALSDQTLTITATSSNTNLIPNPAVNYTSGEATGQLTFIPVSDSSGTAVVTVRVEDDGGTENGGIDTVIISFDVAVTAVNDVPTIANITDTEAILEDAGEQTINLSGIGTGAANEDQTITITATSSDISIIPDPTVVYTSPNAEGTLSYTPVANANGTATITVTVHDDGGTDNDGIDTAAASFTVAVTAINDPPVMAGVANQYVDEDDYIAVLLVADDVDAGDDLEYFAYADTSAVMTSIDGHVLFLEPIQDWNGTATITAGVSDGEYSDSTTFSLTVNDMTPPVVGSVVDGLEGDLGFTASTSTLSASWSGFSDTGSGIQFYEYAVGTTSGGTDMTDWTVIDLDTTVTDSSLALVGGQIYHISVRATDLAQNTSDIVSSDGITVDIQAPQNVFVYDGLDADDQDVSISTNTLSARWYFTDSLSGVASYRYAIGTTAEGTQLVDWIETDADSFFTHSDLELLSGTTYYVSVTATDAIGNESSSSVTDGISVDFTPPEITNMSIDPLSFVSATNDTEIEIEFSEPLQSHHVELAATIQSGYAVTSVYSEDPPKLNLTLQAPFASMDTLTLTVNNVVDLAGVQAEEQSFTYYSNILADYNSDQNIDIFDLVQFIQAWTNNDITLELGPVTGTVPHLIPALDNLFTVRDAMTFSRLWYWSNTSATNTIAVRSGVGAPIEINQSGRKIIITLPDGSIASEIAIEYPLENMEFSYQSKSSQENEIVASKKFGEELVFIQLNGFITSDDAAQEKEIMFDINGSPEHEIELVIHYRFIGSGSETIGSGSYRLNYLPMPDEFSLYQNYPNPFNPVTQIKYDLPEASHVQLLIYDILGREVTALVNEVQEPGYRSITWHGTDAFGRNVGAGMYFYSIQAGDFRQVKKMVLLK